MGFRDFLRMIFGWWDDGNGTGLPPTPGPEPRIITLAGYIRTYKIVAKV